jgi:uncharacterized repeat protein (TIGR02543 family)
MFSIIKKYKRKLNNISKISNAGVTLISLIVTIIVLLILAGITIRISGGNNGLIGKTKKGVALYENAASSESQTLDEYADEIKSYVDVPKAATISFSSNVTGWTNGNVIVTAKIDDPHYEIELKSDESDWAVRDKNKITVTYNQQISARVKNRVDKYSEDVATYAVTNIDKTAPDKTAPVLKSNTNSITVTFKQQDKGSGIAKREYSINNGTTWEEGSSVYTFKGLTQGKKYTIITRATDKVNNQSISEVASITTKNIPTPIKGENLTFVATPSGWTNNDVKLTVSTTETSYSLQTSTDGKIWGTTNPLTYSANGTAYARLWDGNNASAIASTSVTNIDKLEPTDTAPTVATTTNKITATLKQVDQNAGSGSGKSDLNASKTQYRLVTNTSGTTAVTGKDWQSGNVFSGLTQNTTYYVQTKVTDNAGNTTTSEVATARTTSVPTPTAGANVIFTPSTSSWTNGNVNVTVSTTITGFTLQTSTDGKSWGTTNPLTYTANGTAYARLWDGNNASAVATRSITNIDKTAPTVTINPNGGLFNTREVSVTVTGADAGGSNIKTTQYAWSNSNTTEPTGWTNFTNGTAIKTTLNGGISYLWLNIKDNAGNRCATKVSNAFTINTPPSITANPTNVIVKDGENATFSITATNGYPSGISYQWQKKNSLQKTATSTTSSYSSDAMGNYFIKTASDNWYTGINVDNTSVTPGKRYTWSFEVYSDKAITPRIDFNCTAGGYTGNDAAMDSLSNTTTAIPANTWTKIIATCTIRNDAKNPVIFHSFCPTVSENTKVHYRNSMLYEEGEGGWTNISGATQNSYKLTANVNDHDSLYRCVVSNSKVSMQSQFAVLGVLGKPSINLKLNNASGAQYTSGSWTKENVFHTITTAGQDIAKYQYSHDNQNWTDLPTSWTYSKTKDNTATYVINWAGQWNFYVRGVELSGKTTPVANMFNLKIDKTAPTTTAPTTTNTTNSITATSKQTDSESGIASIQYQIKKNGTSTWGALQSSATFGGLTQNTMYDVRTHTVDKAGNASDSAVTTAKTTTVPSGTTSGVITLTPDHNTWTNTDVKVTARTNQTGYTIQMSTDGKSFTDGTSKTLTSNGTVYARLRDSSNNYGASASISISIIDKVAPKVDLVEEPTNYINSQAKIKVTTDVENKYTKGDYAPWSNNGGTCEDVSSTESGPITSSKTWKFTKTGTGNQWNGWEGTYNGIFSVNSGDRIMLSGYYKTSANAGITSLSAGYVYNSDWSKRYNTTTEDSKLNIVADGKWNYFYIIMKANESFSNGIVGDGPSWNYSTSAGTLYINGLNWRIISSSNTTAKDIHFMKYATGTQNSSYFENGNGTYLDGNEFTITNNGTYTVWAKDIAGNTTIKTINITNFDKTAPTTIAPTATTRTNSITATNKQTDALSGIASIQYQIKKNGTSTWGSLQSSATFGGLTQNTKYDVRTRAVDKAGNASDSAVTTVTTGTIPGLTTGSNLTFTATPSGWTNGNVSVKVSTTVTGYTLQTSTDGKTWGATNPLTYTANGTAYARLWDGNNASAVATTNITNIDKTAPSFNAKVSNVSSTGYDVIITGVSDTQSGVNRIQCPTWTESNGQDDIDGAWTTSTKSRATKQSDGSYKFRVNITDHKNENGKYITHVYGYDNVGNHKTIVLNATVPAVTITWNANGGTAVNATSGKAGNAIGTLPTTTRTGYTFAGWFTAASGGTQITTTSTYPTSGNVTYYAHWNVNQYAVTCEDWFVDKSNNRKVKLGSASKKANYGTTVNGSEWGTDATMGKYHSSYVYKSSTSATVGTSGATVYRYFYIWIDVNILNPSGVQDSKSAYFSLSNDGTNWDTNLVNESSKSNNLPYGTVLRIKDLRPYYSYYEYASCSGCTYSNGQWTYTATAPNSMVIKMKDRTYSLQINPNGGTWNGTSAVSTLNKKYSEVTSISAPTRTGYTFTGFSELLNTQKFNDGRFDSGNNGVGVYNNKGNGQVTVTRQVKSSDNPIGGSYELKVTNAGKQATSPNLGGFVQTLMSEANKKYVHLFIAKLPAGYYFYNRNNPLGNGSSTFWLTSNKGTGNWQVYAYQVNTGSSGTFSTFGHVDVSPSATSEWVDRTGAYTAYLAFSNIYDITTKNAGIGQIDGSAVLTANWQDKTAPTTTAPTTTTTTNSITATNKQTDNGSGIASIQYQIKKNGTSTWGALQSGATFGGLTQNTKYDVRTRAVDKAGNASYSGVTTVTTGTIPTPVRGSNVTFTPTPSGWTKGNVSVKVSTSVSGYTLQTSTNGSTWGTTNPLTYTAKGTAYARLWDGTNASSAATLNVTNIDKLAPTNTAPTAVANGNKITVTLKQTDATATSSYGQSGIKSSETRYAIKKSSSSTWGAWQTSNSFTGLEIGTSYNIKTKVTDNAGNSRESNVSTVTTSVIGCYADVNDDGKVDGVIFIDLAFGASGNWNPGNNSWAASNNTGVYSYSAVTSGLRSYKISTKTSSYTGKFGTKQVIVPNGTSGNTRFYVMALSDYDTYWYNWTDACSKRQTVGSVTFRLPSKEEWSAFGGQLGIDKSNYSSKYGLRYYYWSTTEYDSTLAWHAWFDQGHMYYFNKTTYSLAVRLCATF